MGLIPKTGRRSLKVRMLFFGMFTVLSLGALSMLLPFGLMLSGATRTGVDQQEFRLLPRFLSDDTVLFRKHIEALYNESPAMLRAAWRSEDVDFSRLELLAEEDLNRDAVYAWREFSVSAGETVMPGYSLAPVSRSRPLNVRGFARYLKTSVSPRIARVNAGMEMDFPDWNAFAVLPPDDRSRLGIVGDTAWWRAWATYLREEAPVWTLSSPDLGGFFHERVWVPLHGRDAEAPGLTERLPGSEAADEAWLSFVRGIVHPRFVRVDPAAVPAWRELLRQRHVDLETFRRVTGQEAAQWEGISLPGRWSEAGRMQADWEAFLQGWKDPSGELHQAPPGSLSLDSADLRWSAQSGRPPPQRDEDQLRFEENKRVIRRHFLTQHLATVWEILILDGRGLGNTVFYCAAAVLLALFVNPLAAYALSRFRPPNAYALLLFLLLTMAFPPMVTQIPVFLMLRDFGLLNTFWALLLPGMAHGYSIFLLKGFFDSLPRDLYESAALDGAGEIRMFWMITFSLSKPILAVIALSAFVSAYTNFMFALLICQDESMWTLMVWLYQMQQNYGPGVMNAAFVLAALPTLLVFLIAQNQIMRGIVVPVEK